MRSDPDPNPSGPARECAILAGGRGRRLGGRKPLIELAGIRLIDRMVAIAAAAGLEPFVVAKPEAELEGVGAELVIEDRQPLHPLLGIATALERRAAPLVVCPCDAPLLPPPLLAELAHRPEPVLVVASEGGLEPLIGRYPPAAASPLARAAREGLPAQAAVAALGPKTISGPELARFGDPEATLANVNTDRDLARVERLLATRKRPADGPGAGLTRPR